MSNYDELRNWRERMTPQQRIAEGQRKLRTLEQYGQENTPLYRQLAKRLAEESKAVRS